MQISLGHHLATSSIVWSMIQLASSEKSLQHGEQISQAVRTSGDLSDPAFSNQIISSCVVCQKTTSSIGQSAQKVQRCAAELKYFYIKSLQGSKKGTKTGPH